MLRARPPAWPLRARPERAGRRRRRGRPRASAAGAARAPGPAPAAGGTALLLALGGRDRRHGLDGQAPRRRAAGDAQVDVVRPRGIAVGQHAHRGGPLRRERRGGAEDQLGAVLDLDHAALGAVAWSPSPAAGSGRRARRPRRAPRPACCWASAACRARCRARPRSSAAPAASVSAVSTVPSPATGIRPRAGHQHRGGALLGHADAHARAGSRSRSRPSG